LIFELNIEKMRGERLSATEELEQYAVKYATAAIKLDGQGSRGMAITNYQRAVEVLLQLCTLYPNAPQNRFYMERAESYRKRIKELQTGQMQQEQIERTSLAQFEQLVLTEKPNVRWEDIADLKDAKRALQESIIYPVRRPDLFPLGWPRGILLFGPPGCGKTLLAAAVATEVNAAFYCIDAASIMSKWLGESERNVAQLFKTARAASENGQPSIIFIDEIDSLIGVRIQEIGGEIRTRNQFLKEMDSIFDKNKSTNVYVIGATNKPWVLDDPFIRRFQKRVFVPLPDFDARLEMFKIYAQNLKPAPDINFEELAKATEGYSGSDIRDLFQSVQIRVAREFFEANNPNDRQAKPRIMTMQDFYVSVEERKPSVSPEILTHYERWFEAFKAL
jgi:SpoVK/Ycf46/Vps4 family AAA+-type ATPase